MGEDPVIVWIVLFGLAGWKAVELAIMFFSHVHISWISQP